MRCVATFISNGRNSNEKRMEQLRAAVEELKAVTDSETEDYQQRQVESTTTDTCRQGMPVERSGLVCSLVPFPVFLVLNSASKSPFLNFFVRRWLSPLP